MLTEKDKAQQLAIFIHSLLMSATEAERRKSHFTKILNAIKRKHLGLQRAVYENEMHPELFILTEHDLQFKRNVKLADDAWQRASDSMSDGKDITIHQTARPLFFKNKDLLKKYYQLNEKHFNSLFPDWESGAGETWNSLKVANALMREMEKGDEQHNL